MLIKLTFLGFLALCVANPTGQRHEVYGPPKSTGQDIEDNQGSVVFVEGYPAGVTKEACPNYPFCGPSPSSTEKPHHSTGPAIDPPIVPSTQFDITKYPSGVVHSEGTIKILYEPQPVDGVPVTTIKPAQTWDGTSTIGAQVPVNWNIYPEGVNPKTCPNYPYCDGVPTEGGQLGTKPIVVPDTIETIAYPPGVTVETCPNYPFCDHGVQKIGDTVNSANGAPHGAIVHESVKPIIIQNAEIVKYPEGVSPSNCPNYPFCDPPVVGQPNEIQAQTIVTHPTPSPVDVPQSGVQVSATLNVLPEGINPETCPNYPYCNGVQAIVGNTVQQHVPTVTSDAIIVDSEPVHKPTPSKPINDGLKNRPTATHYAETKPNINSGVQQPAQGDGIEVAYPPGVTVETCPNYPFCDGITETDYVNKLPHTNVPQIFQVVVPVSQPVHKTDGVHYTITYPEGVDPAFCPDYPFCKGSQPVPVDITGNSYTPTQTQQAAIKYNIHHGPNTPQGVHKPQAVAQATTGVQPSPKAVHHAAHHGAGQQAIINSVVPHVSGSQDGIDHNIGFLHGVHHTPGSHNTGLPQGGHHVSGSHSTGFPHGGHHTPGSHNTGFPQGGHHVSGSHNTGFPHGGHHNIVSQHKFPAGVTPQQCPNYPFCDGFIFTNVDHVHQHIVQIPEIKPIVVIHKGIPYPPGVTPETCPNYPFCDGKQGEGVRLTVFDEIHNSKTLSSSTTEQDLTSIPVTTTTSTTASTTNTTPTTASTTTSAPTTVSSTTGSSSTDGSYHYPVPKVKFQH